MNGGSGFREGEAPAEPHTSNLQRPTGSAGASPSRSVDPLPQRSRPASGVLHVEGKSTIIYDTVCTKDRKPWLATDAVHALLRKVRTEADAWAMGRYMIMPDHIHYFAGFTGSPIEFAN